MTSSGCIGLKSRRSKTGTNAQVAVSDEDRNGGRYRIRTYDFHRVNFEFNEVEPFACFAFPPSIRT